MAKYYTPTKLSENMRETPEGFLLCLSVPIARTGWMEYGEDETPLEAGESGIVNIHRDAKEVFSPKTIASFEGKAITIRHPSDFVTPDNWSYLAKGIIQNVRKTSEKDEDGEECLVADLLVMDAFAINLIKSGLREVSCGYEAEYEQTGEGEGSQTNIVGNHLALVEQGRAGSSYAINDEKKGKVNMSQKMIEKLKAKFGAKAVDEAMAEKKEDKATDAEMYDALMKDMKEMKDAMARVEGFMENGKAKDEEVEKKDDKESKDEEEKKDDEKAKDDMDESEDEEGEKKDDEKAKDEEGAQVEERLKALEAAVAKLLKMQAGDEEEDIAGGEAEDAEEGEEGEESQKKTGDAKKKKTGLESTKDAKNFDDQFDSKAEVMTPEKLNEINAAHWARK